MSRHSSGRSQPSQDDATTLPGASSPMDPNRPCAVLVSRLNEVKRITKTLVSYFEGLASSHVAHSKTLLSLAPLPATVQESHLFIPATRPDPEGGHHAVGGEQGWMDVLNRIRDSTREEGEGHARLAKAIHGDVIEPLKKLRGEIKHHIGAIEKEVNKTADNVAKERESSLSYLTALSVSLAAATSPSPFLQRPQPAQDPFIIRTAAEVQMRGLVEKENELLRIIQGTQARAEVFEKSIWEKVNLAWSTWEAAHSKVCHENLTRATGLATTMASLPPSAEWQHFASLGYMIDPATPTRDISQIDYPNRNDPQTIPVYQGIMERQKKFLKNWTTATFIVTPCGYLHEFTSSTPTSSPTHSTYLPHTVVVKSVKHDFEFNLEATVSGSGEKPRTYRGKSQSEVDHWYGIFEAASGKKLVAFASPIVGAAPVVPEVVAEPIVHAEPLPHVLAPLNTDGFMTAEPSLMSASAFNSTSASQPTSVPPSPVTAQEDSSIRAVPAVPTSPIIAGYSSMGPTLPPRSAPTSPIVAQSNPSPPLPPRAVPTSPVVPTSPIVPHSPTPAYEAPTFASETGVTRKKSIFSMRKKS